ncbi:penicillin-binding protein [Pediococcus argentinicus]|uniref:Penicillin-binding protein n=3 Tax=Pediococcus argentinicus TaxID=480391 RepID=A0A0R2N9K3_9LACO|nr:penicillin-binding protein [Pediococcus argentinicus]
MMLLPTLIVSVPISTMAKSNNATESTQIKKILKQHHLKGQVLSITNYKNSHEALGYGYANKAENILNSNPNVIYPGASLQKSMTGAMMVQVINDSQKSKNPITQNTLISRWYPQLKNSNRITIGNLLTQTSGIMDNKAEVDPGKILSEDSAVNDTIQRINSQASTMDTGSNKFHYCNDNYILIAGIISHFTKKSYADNLVNRIIKPAGLKHTFMWNQIPQGMLGAHIYKFVDKDYQHGQVPTGSSLSYILGAGNMYTTPSDYYTYCKALKNGSILNNSDYKYMTNLKAQSTKHYNSGFYIDKLHDMKFVYGSLDSVGNANFVNLTIGNKYGVILFANQTVATQSETSVKDAAAQIIKYVAPKAYAE